jgi:hypothetical protein
VLRIDGTTDGPERSLLALHPDNDQFLGTGIVEAVDGSLGEPALG